MSAAGSDRKIGSALSERDELASELADLQAIERSLETFGYSTASIGATEPSAATNEELNDVHLTAAKKAFADYDLNKNGCIEVNELAYLTAEMGYPLEGKDVIAALKAINTSNTGKITFDEFWVWWNGSTQSSATRDSLALGLLRARLWHHKGQKLLSQIGKLKGVAFPDAKSWDTSDAKTHTWTFAVGDMAAAAAASASADSGSLAPSSSGAAVDSKSASAASSLVSGSSAVKGRASLKFHHNLVLDTEIDNDPKYTLFYSFDVRSVSGKTDFQPWLSTVTKSLGQHFPQLMVTSVTAPKKDIVRITFGIVMPFPDPAAVLDQFGLTPELAARVFNVNVELGTRISDIVSPNKPSLADILKFRVDAHVHIENALLATAGPAMANLPNNRDARDFAAALPFIGALESNASFVFGDVSELISGLVEYTRGKYGENSGEMRDLKPFTKVISDQMAKVIERERKDQHSQIKYAIPGIKTGLLTAARDFSEIVQLAMWTRSGCGITIEADQVLIMKDLMAVVDFAEAALYAPAGGAGGAANGPSPKGAHNRKER